MEFDAWITLGTVALVVAALATNKIGIDVVMVGGLTLLLLFGVLPVDDAIVGFAHPAIMLIGALFVVAAGVRRTGAMEMVAARLLGRPATILAAQLRLMLPVAVLSGFMNNTPIVAIYLPIVNDWARRLRISPSKLYLPLSYAAIMGGKLTYIGTGSNIVLVGLYVAFLRDNPDGWTSALGVETPSEAMRFWGIAWLGVPALLAGVVTVILLSRWLLPERKPAVSDPIDARQYQSEMVVMPDASIVGRNIEEAGLRHLPGLYLSGIERDGELLPAVSPDTRLQADDRLNFVGVLESVVDLRKIRGLVPATDQVEKVNAPLLQRTLVEAVVSNNSPFAGKTVRAARFRTLYNAAIIAVHRAGQKVNAKIGDIVLQPGDTLLLETHPGFRSAHRNSSAFYLVSQVENSRRIHHERASLALVILGLLITLFILSPIDKVVTAFLCAMLMIGTRCVTGSEARTSINWQILVVIGAALGIGQALDNTGAATAIAEGLLGLFEGLGPRGMLFVVFIVGCLFAQLVTNYGAAILMFPMTMATAESLNVSPEPFVFTLMVAAGANFISPYTYQTNLMVYGAGGYRLSDFVRMGIPVAIVTAVVCTFVAPLVFPFVP